MKLSVLTFTILMALTACTVGPDFERPQTQAQEADAFINAVSGDEAQETQKMSKWWERIDDPLLSEYVDQLLKDNLQLKEAASRIEEARARLGVVRGGFFPRIGADTSGARSFVPSDSQKVGGVENGLSSNDRRFTTSYDAGLSTAWELDVFGRIRRSTESARAEFNAREADQEALTHSLIAELLNRRIAISVNQRLLELAEQNAANRKQIYDLVKRRYDLGTAQVRLEDVLLTEENMTTVQSDINEFRRLLTDEIYALDILLGQMPGTTDPTETAFPFLPAPLDVAVCTPAHLLDRRPDLRASELRLQAANADIGVAMADVYPTLNLSENIGFTGDSSGSLLSSDQLTGSLIGALTARIFEGGALRSNIRLQEAEAQTLIYSYANTVLNAVREVESALQAERELGEEVTSLNRSVEALKQAEALSQDRYRNGLLPLRDFLDTQQRRYTIEQNAILSQRSKWQTRIALYLTLGGDWFLEKTDEGACL